MSGVRFGYWRSGTRIESTGWGGLTSLGGSEGVDGVEVGTRDFAGWVGIGFAD
jgi:hypothetical protein